jgi:hypothetical protein
MALDFGTNPTFTGRITAPDANYPQGSSKDETSAGANDGMPYIKQRADDILGMQQALLLEAAVTPSGSADTALLSDYLDAMKKILKSGRKNFLINGGFDIWQRGTSFTDPDDAYTADRFKSDVVSGTGNGTISRQEFTASTVGNVAGNPHYFLRHIQSVAVSSAVALLVQRAEGVRNLQNTKAVLSFSARVASGTKTFATQILQNFGTGGGPSSAVATSGGTFEATTTFQRFSFVIDVPTINGKTIGTNLDDYVEAQIREESGFSTYTLEIANMQLEIGSIATDFEKLPVAETLGLCERYFEKSYAQSVDPGTTTAGNAARMLNGIAAPITTQIGIFTEFKNVKRTSPAINTFSVLSGATGSVVEVNAVGTNAATRTAVISNTNDGGFYAGFVTVNTLSAGITYQWTADAEL